MTRNRNRTVTHGGTGFAKALTVGLSDQVTTAGYRYDECSDVVGNRSGQNPLFLAHSMGVRWWASGRINGWWDTTNVASVTSVAGFAYYAHHDIPPTSTKPSNNSAYSEGLAKTNPNTPVVDLPLFVWELGDIPRMVKDWADTLIHHPIMSAGENLNDLPRSLASRHLEWKFAIEPFLNDLKGILDFEDSVSKKLRYLDRLGAPGGSVRSGTVYKDEANHPVGISGYNYATSLYQEGRTLRVQDSVKREMWVSTKWIPQVPIPKTDFEKRMLAKRLAFGEEISFSLLWNAFPWSWLIDWFSNVGDVLNNTRNILPVKFGDSCLMDHTILRRKLHDVQPGSGTLQIRMPEYLYDEKIRTPMGSDLPQIEFGMPLITAAQATILSALTVLKGKVRL